MTDHELIETLRRLRYDLTAMQVKVSEALRMAGSLNLVPNERARCSCGLTFGSVSRLAEHVYTSHGGPVPAHWVSGEGGSSMSLWKRKVEQRLDRLERSRELTWQDQRISDLERLVREVRAATFPDEARAYFALRVLYVGEEMSEAELLAAVRADIKAAKRKAA